MTYHIQMSAFNRIGEGVRSHSIVLGHGQSLARQDILSEPWFLATVLGSIGGLLWLVFCIFSIWLYRRHKAASTASSKVMLTNAAAYTAVNQKLCEKTQLYNIALATPNYAQKEMLSTDMSQTIDGRGAGYNKDCMYGVDNLQTTPALKTFYNKSLLAAEPYGNSELNTPSPLTPPTARVLLPITGGAFRPVHQSAYMIRPSGGRGPLIDNIKPDGASSTSSSNETTTNNDNYTDVNDCEKSDRVFEQCDFTNSPMSECEPLVDYLSTQSRPILYLPPPPEQPPPTDIGTSAASPAYSPTDSLDREQPALYSYQPRNVSGTAIDSHSSFCAPKNISSFDYHSHIMTADSEPEFKTQVMDTEIDFQQPYLGTDNNIHGNQHSQYNDVTIPTRNDNNCYSPVSIVSEIDVHNTNDDWNLMPVADDVQESELSYSDVDEDDDDDDVEASDESTHNDCSSGQAHTAHTSVVGLMHPVKKPSRVRQHDLTSPYTTDRNCQSHLDTESLGHKQRHHQLVTVHHSGPPPIAAKPKFASLAANGHQSNSQSTPRHTAMASAASETRNITDAMI
jgi:hypothetical protein